MIRVQLIAIVLVVCVGSAAAQQDPYDLPPQSPPQAPPAQAPPTQAPPTQAPMPATPMPSAPTDEPGTTYSTAPGTAPAPPPNDFVQPKAKRASPFAQGNLQLSILFGFGSAFGDDHFILGAGIGYYILDGLELEVGAEVWMFGYPTITKLTPGLRYVFSFVPVIKPYVGGFYRYTFMESPFDNVGSLGLRAGVLIMQSPKFVLGLGVVYEDYLNKSYNSVWYPEITVGVLL
jgi:hypothetical protein